MWSIIASVVGAVIGPLVSLFGKALAVFGAYRAGRSQGRLEQAVADLQETATTVRKANEGRAAVGSESSDTERMLESPATRGRK